MCGAVSISASRHKCLRGNIFDCGFDTDMIIHFFKTYGNPLSKSGYQKIFFDINGSQFVVQPQVTFVKIPNFITQNNTSKYLNKEAITPKIDRKRTI